VRWSVDKVKPLTEEDLAACLRLAEELSANMLPRDNATNAKSIVADMERLVGEIGRLRAGKWLDQAVLEIAGDPMCCDISSSSPRAMIAVMRKHLKAEVGR
jgi:hypothetical protein